MKYPSHDQLLAGKFCGVFVDDSGTPGQQSESPFLDPSRKTWVAVLLTSTRLADAQRQFPGALQLLSDRLGVREFHAADLLSGKGPLRAASLDVRLGVLAFLAHLFASYQFPIIVQTAGEQTVKDHHESLNAMGSIGPFDFASPVDLALLFLVRRVRDYLKENRAAFSKPSLLVIDEGRMKAGTFVKIPVFGEFAHGGGALFCRSHDVFPLQLADFAAFGINRMQWLAAKMVRTELENEQLRILSSANFKCINVPRMTMKLESWTGLDFDKFHEEDRAKKGLQSPPPRMPKPPER